MECENKISNRLSKNKNIADILEDDELINVLDEFKATSHDIKIRLAFRASIFFLTIIDLSAISEMYQYSLQWFSGLFESSVDNSTKSTDN